MKTKKLYLAGSILVFLGLLWMLLPHASHAFITNKDKTEHYIHLFQGLALFLIGLSIMLWSNKKERHKINSNRRRSFLFESI